MCECVQLNVSVCACRGCEGLFTSMPTNTPDEDGHEDCVDEEPDHGALRRHEDGRHSHHAHSGDHGQLDDARGINLDDLEPDRSEEDGGHARATGGPDEAAGLGAGEAAVRVAVRETASTVLGLFFTSMNMYEMQPHGHAHTQHTPRSVVRLVEEINQIWAIHIRQHSHSHQMYSEQHSPRQVAPLLGLVVKGLQIVLLLPVASSRLVVSHSTRCECGACFC